MVVSVDKNYVDTLKRWARVYTDGMYPDEKTELMLGFDPIDSGLSGWCWSNNIVALNLEGVCMDQDAEECQFWIDAGDFLTTREMVYKNQKQHYGGVAAALKYVAECDSNGTTAKPPHNPDHNLKGVAGSK